MPFWPGYFICLFVLDLYMYVFVFCDLLCLLCFSSETGFVFVRQSHYWNIILFEVQDMKLAYSFITDRIGVPVLIVYSTS